MIVRGGVNIPINIGGIVAPSATVRLNLAIVQNKFNPLEYIDLVNAPAGQQGLFIITFYLSPTIDDCHTILYHML
jgi:hypothetical protein